MKIPVSLRLALWVLGTWSLFALLAKFTSFPALHWFPLAILGIGIFLFRERPLMRAGFPLPFETSLVAACALIFMAYAGWTVLGPHLESERQAGLPCAPKSIEAQCYTFSRDNCSSLWIHFESECKAEAKKKMEGKASTKLLGPGIKRCTYKRLDQSFRSNRRTPIHPECNAHFSSLDSLSAD